MTGDQMHAGIMEWMRGAELRADPAQIIDTNAPVGLKFWGYYDRITTVLKASEEELLRTRAQD